MKNKHLNNFFYGVESISKLIDKKKIQKLAEAIYKIKKKRGRLFFLGVGGSAGNCSHAVYDFRKICNIESYCPTDNVSELTARINDEGWETSFQEWLKSSNLSKKDAIFIMSVGGGNLKKKISVNLIKSINFAKKQNSKIFGIVGRKDGYTFKHGDVCIDIPYIDNKLITPFSESFQAIIWHCLVSHPILQDNKTKW